MTDKLTPKQEAFCQEYLKDLNATQAAIRAGYSVETARSIGQENLTKPDIENHIQELMREREERVLADADYVLRRLLEIDQMSIKDVLNDDGSIKPVMDWPDTWARYVSSVDVSEMKSEGETLASVLKKIKWPDKIKNLELLGKHVRVQAFSDKLDLTSKDGSMSPQRIVFEVIDNAKNTDTEVG